MKQSMTLIMSLEARKKELAQYILGQISEERLSVFESLRKDDSIIGYDMDGNALSSDDAKIEYTKRLKDINNGKHTTLENLKKEASQW